MKKKLSVAFILIAILVLATAAALAVMTLNAFYSHQEGRLTSGITFTADDVYFDGYLLMVPITMTPNDSGVTVYEDVLGNYDTSYEIEEILRAGSIPLGAYCDIQLYDAAGQEVGSLMTGTGERLDSAYRMTFSFHFLPNNIPEELHVKVMCGVMETPGQTIGDVEVFDFIVISQEQVYTKSVKIVDSDDLLPYLDEVFIAKTKNVAGIYIFFAGDTEAYGAPFRFAETEAELPATPNAGYDAANNRLYIYHAILASEMPTTLHIYDGREYLINLEDGAVTLIE